MSVLHEWKKMGRGASDPPWFPDVTECLIHLQASSKNLNGLLIVSPYTTTIVLCVYREKPPPPDLDCLSDFLCFSYRKYYTIRISWGWMQFASLKAGSCDLEEMFYTVLLSMASGILHNIVIGIHFHLFWIFNCQDVTYFIPDHASPMKTLLPHLASLLIRPAV